MLKKFIGKVIDLISSDKHTMSSKTCILIILVMLSAYKYLPIKFLFITCIFLSLVSITYAIIYFKKRKNYLLGGIMLVVFFWGISMSTMYFLKLKNIAFSENAFAILGLVLLMIIFLLAYLRVLKIGDEEKIKRIRILLPIAILLLLFFIFLLIC